MAITLTGTGGLFTRIGKILNAINVINTHRGTTVVADFDELDDQYEDDLSLVDGLQNALVSHQSASGSVFSSLRTLAEETVIEMVRADNRQESGSLEDALQELITQMEDSSDDVDASAVSATAAADAGNAGDGVCVVSTETNRGKDAENIFAEDIIVTCDTDSQSGGATAGAESFRARGEEPESDVLSFNYPQGSGCDISFSSIDASGDNANNNLLTNSDFEDFTADAPDNWTIQTGVAGTDIDDETLDMYEGSAALKLTGDDATLSAIYQVFANDTAGELEPLTTYHWNMFISAPAAIAAGVLTISLVDSTSSTISDEAGTANLASKTLSTVGTSYESWSGSFCTPRVLPSEIRLRLRLSTAITNTKVLLIDHLSLGEATELYPQGLYLTVHGGATAFVAEDSFVVAATNDGAGAFQSGFDRLFAMRELGLLLPSDTGGTESVDDALIG